MVLGLLVSCGLVDGSPQWRELEYRDWSTAPVLTEDALVFKDPGEVALDLGAMTTASGCAMALSPRTDLSGWGGPDGTDAVLADALLGRAWLVSAPFQPVRQSAADPALFETTSCRQIRVYALQRPLRTVRRDLGARVESAARVSGALRWKAPEIVQEGLWTRVQLAFAVRDYDNLYPTAPVVLLRGFEGGTLAIYVAEDAMDALDEGSVLGLLTQRPNNVNP